MLPPLSGWGRWLLLIIGRMTHEPAPCWLEALLPASATPLQWPRGSLPPGIGDVALLAGAALVGIAKVASARG